MTRVSWTTRGGRRYTVGVDRGMLYPSETFLGVPWPGLISVSSAPSGGSITPYYVNGVRTYMTSDQTEEAGTIVAYSSPPEFDYCDGTVAYANKNGMLATNQMRKIFGLSYRNKVGNELDGGRKDYQIHVIYNCLATPSQQEHKSLGLSSEPLNLSWDFQTIPTDNTGQSYIPTSHFIFDTRRVSQDGILALENILYGTVDRNPALPTPAQLANPIYDDYVFTNSKEYATTQTGSYTGKPFTS